MRTNLFRLALATAVAAAAVCVTASEAQDCTAAAVTSAASANHRAMLWKNRDTGELSNRVVFVKEAPYSYIAVVNKNERSGSIVWAGINTEGFAIMNTASYNLPRPDGTIGSTDGNEGILMGTALRTCKTIEDFEALLTAEKGPGLNVTVNFSVIDATGRAHLFETHSKGFTKYDASQTPEKYLLITNFSRSGKVNAGAGYLRFDRALELAKQVPAGMLSPRLIFRDFSRDTGHVLLKSLNYPDFKQHSASEDLWIHNRYTINRSDTACAVVMVSKDPSDPSSRPMMWILPGEPLTAIALPLWPEAGVTPEPFWKGEADAPLWGETLRIKRIIRPFYPDMPEKKEYMNVGKVDNKEGTGYLPTFLATESDVFTATDDFMAKPRTPAELSAFQKAMADKVMRVLSAAKSSADRD
jgi:hypothetical protein